METYSARLKPEYFRGKVIWITGASSGIGLELAKKIVKLNVGAKIILSSRRQEVLESVAKDLLALNAKHSSEDIKIVQLDLENIDSLESKTDEALKQYGRIDVLVNNGGISTRSLARDSKFEVDEKVFKVDYFSAVKISKRLLSHMVQATQGDNASSSSKQHLHIINISSIAGKIFSSLRTSYCSAKAALIMYFDALRLEEPELITVTNICPGSVQTSVAKNALTADGSSFGKTDENIANGMEVERCVELILTAASNNIYEAWIFKIPREKYGVYLAQYLPGTFRKLMIKNAARVKKEYTDRILKSQ